MVRRKVEIKPIEEKSKRYTTFTKRRDGLFKKAKELCKLCGGEAAVVAISNAENMFLAGHHNVKDVINRYVDHSRAGEHTGDQSRDMVVVAPLLTEVDRMVVDALESGQPDWEEIVRHVGPSTLDELAKLLEGLNDEVAALVENVRREVAALLEDSRGTTTAQAPPLDNEACSSKNVGD